MPYIVPDAVREPLYAIVPYFNPWRWKSREKHTLRALEHFHNSGAVIVLVEAAYNRREFSLADCGIDGRDAVCSQMPGGFKHKYIALRTKDELWLKENLINVAVGALPYDWQQVCWLDSDVHFVRPNWVGECIHKLQHYSFLQMFSQARDVGPNYEQLPPGYPHADGISFVSHWKAGGFNQNPVIRQDVANIKRDIKQLRTDVAKLETDLDYYYGGKGIPIWPGLAWACTRKAWDDVGGLFDIAIWGGGDYDMAHALIEQASSRIHSGVHPNYRQALVEWENRCKKHVRRNVGVMEGTILHYWHGKKTERKYAEKRKLMRKVKFDPVAFLKRDYQGVYQLHDDGSENFVHWRDQMRKIAKERNEDSIDL
jgi:hypothetical protein